MLLIRRCGEWIRKKFSGSSLPFSNQVAIYNFRVYHVFVDSSFDSALMLRPCYKFRKLILVSIKKYCPYLIYLWKFNRFVRTTRKRVYFVQSNFLKISFATTRRLFCEKNWFSIKECEKRRQIQNKSFAAIFQVSR